MHPEGEQVPIVLERKKSTKRYVQQSNVDRLETKLDVSEPKHVTSSNKSTTGRLFVLDLSSGEIFSLNVEQLAQEGSDMLLGLLRLPAGVGQKEGTS